MQLSEHFSLAEFTRSQTAARRDIDNTPSAEIVERLRLVAAELEVVRWWLSYEAGREVPVIVTSGFRCPELNAAVGGSESSAHQYGLAADFVTSRFSPAKVVELLRGRVRFDQLIEEFGEWTHFGLTLGRYRNEVLYFER